MNAMSLKNLSRSHAVIAFTLCVIGSTLCGLNTASWGRGMGEERHPVDLRNGPGAREASRTTEGFEPSKRPNVLLIGVDTLRADHTGCLGYGKDTTPTLDRLAREGVLCTWTMSTSGWTLPSVMSVMTSLYPDVHKTCTYKNQLSGEVTTVAEVLKANGYTTVGFVSNPVLHSRHGFSQGFDLYDDFTVSLDSGFDILGGPNEAVNDQHLVRTSQLLTRTAVKWLERQSGEPFFLFAFYMDPHYDYIPPAPFDTMFDPNYTGEIDGRGISKEPRHSQRPPARDLRHLQALYDGEIRYTDTHVGELLKAFAGSGLLKNTLIVLFGDHGDEFYEHGKTAHNRTLYHEIVHVPLILWWPDRFPAGRRIDAVTSQVDIMPTILDCLGISHDGPMQGTSLRPLIEGKADKVHDTVWAELNTWTHVQAVIGDRDKLIRNVAAGSWELYNLSHDPCEKTNLYGRSSAADMGAAMMATCEQRARDNDALANKLVPNSTTRNAQISEQQLQRLKALGYVQ